jgi:hypothetical protein
MKMFRSGSSMRGGSLLSGCFISHLSGESGEREVSKYKISL